MNTLELSATSAEQRVCYPSRFHHNVETQDPTLNTSLGHIETNQPKSPSGEAQESARRFEPVEKVVK